jgi:hypothetical protein
MRALDLQYDQLVIGADLSALLFAYKNRLPVVFYRKNPPYEYPREDGFEKKTNLWDFCMFNLAINGLVPVSDKTQAIRIEDEVVKVTTKNNLLVSIKYNKVWISDDYKVEGLPLIENKTSNENHVLDLFFIDQKTVLAPTSNYEDNFIKQLIYRPCPTYKKSKISLLAYSKLTDEELFQYEYNETYARLKTLSLIKRKYSDISHQMRTIVPIGKNIYEETDKIKNLLLEPQEIIAMEQKKIPYMDFLEEKLWNKLKTEESGLII